MFCLNSAYAIIPKNTFFFWFEILPIYANLNVQILGLMGMCLLQISHNKLMKKGPKERLLMSLLNLDELPELMPAETFTSHSGGAAVTKIRKDGRLSDVALSYLNDSLFLCGLQHEQNMVELQLFLILEQELKKQLMFLCHVPSLCSCLSVFWPQIFVSYSRIFSKDVCANPLTAIFPSLFPFY